jgi:hypothetical protein
MFKSAGAEKEVMELGNALFEENSQIFAACEQTKLIEIETEKLLSQVDSLEKQASKWIKIQSKLNDQVKELGDLEQFAATIKENIEKLQNKK